MAISESTAEFTKPSQRRSRDQLLQELRECDRADYYIDIHGNREPAARKILSSLRQMVALWPPSPRPSPLAGRWRSMPTECALRPVADNVTLRGLRKIWRGAESANFRRKEPCELDSGFVFHIGPDNLYPDGQSCRCEANWCYSGR